MFLSRDMHAEEEYEERDGPLSESSESGGGKLEPVTFPVRVFRNVCEDVMGDPGVIDKSCMRLLQK